MLIDGILLEGVDFVGKTTVAMALVDAFAEASRPATLGKCYLQRTPLIEFLEERAKESDNMLGRDWYYSAALLSDLYGCRHVDSFVVQDRHWLTQVGRNRFFHPDVEIVRPGLIEERHHPFRYNVLLTSDLASKLARSRSRLPNSPRDAYLAANPDLHQEYERFLVGLLPADENWMVLDTSGLSVAQVTGAILRSVAEHA